MTEDDEIADRLLLPPCRPEMIAGIPYKWFIGLVWVWICGLMMFGAIITGTGICFAIWGVLRAVTSVDFNAIPVFTVWCRTKLVATRSTIWPSGITLDPLYGPRNR